MDYHYCDKIPPISSILHQLQKDYHWQRIQWLSKSCSGIYQVPTTLLTLVLLTHPYLQVKSSFTSTLSCLQWPWMGQGKFLRQNHLWNITLLSTYVSICSGFPFRTVSTDTNCMTKLYLVFPRSNNRVGTYSLGNTHLLFVAECLYHL